MMPGAVFSGLALLAVLAAMAIEARIASRHERELRRRGAVEPAGDVYRTMQWAYPAAFGAMALEGALSGTTPGVTAVAGAALMVAAKALKYWAIAALGPRWTFRVLVMAEPLVTRGPYRWLRHPNYVAVIGELAAMALLVAARVTGPLATVLFGLLIWKRIAVENHALRHPTCS